MSDQIGDGPISEEFRTIMLELAKGLDDILNGEDKDKKRTVGFILMVFPMNTHEGRCNYISNASRKDIVVLLKEQLARFEGMADQKGNA